MSDSSALTTSLSLGLITITKIKPISDAAEIHKKINGTVLTESQSLKLVLNSTVTNLSATSMLAVDAVATLPSQSITLAVTR